MATRGRDVFLSYTWSDLDLAAHIERALEQSGITVFVDRDLSPFEPITAGLTAELHAAKVLLAVYSARFPTRYACQWEFTRAFLSGQREGDPRRRVLVVNPEADESHIEPVTFQDTAYLSAYNGLDSERLVKYVRIKVREAGGPLGTTHPARARWLPERVQRSRRFVGRYPAMWRVHTALTARDAALAHPTVASAAAVVKGFTGTGKTWLAEQYAFLFQDAYPGGVFWIDFAGVRPDDAVATFLGRLREEAGEGGLRLGAAGTEPERLRRMVGEHFTRRREDALWVLDDLPRGLRREQFDRLLLASPFVRVLATSQDGIEGWDGPVVETAGLTELEGQVLFGYDWQDLTRTDRDAVSRLVQRSGGHPMVLAATSASLRNSQGGTGEHFSASLDAASGRVIDVLRTRVRELEPATRTVLAAAATLSAAPFPATLLVRALREALQGSVEQVVVEALGALDGRSLVQRLDRLGRTMGGQRWQLHPLVAEAVRQEAGTLDTHAPPLAEALLEQLGGDEIGDVPEADGDAAHVHARELAGREAVPPALRVRLLRAVAESHRRRGDSVLAEDAAAALLALTAALGRIVVDDLLLGARTALGAGDFGSTLRRSREALALADRDDNLRDGYRARFLLAQAHDQLGQYAEADAAFRYHLPGWVPQPERHLIQLTRVTGLRLRGRVREALELLAQLMPQLPHESRHDLLSGLWPVAALELARLQMTTSAIMKARRTSAEIVDTYRRAGAEEHPNCRQAMGLHAEAELHVALTEMNVREDKWDRAVREIAALRAEHERRYGEDNPVTLAFAVLEGRALLNKSQARQALVVLTEAEPRIIRVLGQHHPLHHRVRYGMAQAHLQLHRWERARFMLEDLLPRQIATLGRHHVDSLVTRLDIGTCLAVAGRMDEARPLLYEAARDLHRQFGWLHEPSFRAKVSWLYAQLPASIFWALVKFATVRRDVPTATYGQGEHPSGNAAAEKQVPDR